MSALEIDNVCKDFGTTRVLEEVSLAIDSGEFLILVGPSGCGKSTLMNAIAGLEPVTSGRILVGGDDITWRTPAERDIAMVFQSYALYPSMTVRGNIAFGLEMRKVPKAEREAAVERVADLLQISHLLDRKPAQLSGGQRQRVAMGRAWRGNRRSISSTSRSPTWTPSCASRCAPRSRSSTNGWAPPSSM